LTQGRLAVLTAYGEPFEVREYPVPDPGPGAMVVKVTQSAICGSDLHMWRRDSEGIPVPPGGRAMGHEGTGTVFRLGEGVTTDFLGAPLAEGDRVIHSVIVGCHRCHLCLRGEENLCLNKTVTPPAGTFPYFVGTFADYYYVPAGMPVFKVPDGLRDDVLAPVNCAMGTATQALMSAGCGQGDYVVVQGAGGLGLTATAMAKDMGADKVIVLDRIDARLEVAREFGADHTINVEEFPTADQRVKMLHDRDERQESHGLGHVPADRPGADPRLPGSQPGPAAVREAGLTPLSPRRHQPRLRPVGVGRPADAGGPRRARALNRSLHGDQSRHCRHRR
jgi:D-arabinose 1-dehydrogenase-like Zn-dependent alcohol dehydrogenase